MPEYGRMASRRVCVRVHGGWMQWRAIRWHADVGGVGHG